MFDVIIIGAGIAGASLAYELAADQRILLLERETFPGYHSTGRSVAQFSETYGNATVQRLSRASRSFFQNPPPGFAEHRLLEPRSWLVVARDDQLPALDAFEAAPRPAGVTTRRMSRDACLADVPILRAEYVAAGVYEDGASDIDVHALHEGYLRGARSRGAAIRTDADAQSIRFSKNGWSVQVGSERFTAPVLVNAAGAWADNVALAAGASTIGLQPLRRTALILNPPNQLAVAKWPMVMDIDEEFYFKPDAGKLLASPADETPCDPCDARPDEFDIAVCIDRMERVTDLKFDRVARSWAGLRSFVADRSPVIGFDPRAKGFFWFAGQGGYGIQIAPAAAQLAASLICGRAIPEAIEATGLDAASLGPARLTAAL